MPLATLMNFNDPIYDFEHAMAHRAYYAVMSPLSDYSVLPYFIEPMPRTPPPPPATNWRLNHQQAHNDYRAAIPGYWGADSIGFGIPQSQNMIDSSFTDPSDMPWWTFVNHQEHYTANDAILPLSWTDPQTWLRGTEPAYPFW